jgi:hypothetical protein
LFSNINGGFVDIGMPTPVPVADNGISDIESDVIIMTPVAVPIVHILLGRVDGKCRWGNGLSVDTRVYAWMWTWMHTRECCMSVDVGIDGP